MKKILRIKDTLIKDTQDQRYSQIEIESAIIEFWVTKNHINLYGLPEFIIITDHKPLVSISSAFQRDSSPRILKRKLGIQGYNYTIQYEPRGAANSADYLSRHTNNMYKEINALEQRTENFIYVIMQSCLFTALTIKKIHQTMTHRCKYYRNPLWTVTSLSKTNKPWHHTSTPSKNSLHQMTLF